MTSLQAGLALFKFRYHVTFVNVVFGALLFAPAFEWGLAAQLGLLYVSFNVFLYGGIYTLNDIADRAADVRHPRKRGRPIAAGLISVPAGATIALTLIVLGLVSASLLFDRPVVACHGAVLAFNAFYSLKARNLRYADVLFNSVTHPTRFLMGVLLVGRVPPATHLAALLMLAVTLSCLRRDIERDVPGWQARETISRYADGELSGLAFCGLTGLGLMAILHAAHAPGFYAIVLSTTAVVAGGGWLARPVRARLRGLWTY